MENQTVTYKYKHRINIQGVNGTTITFDALTPPSILPVGSKVNI
jgi:hypothetical protein